MRCFKILELHNKREREKFWEKSKGKKRRRRRRICVLCGHKVWVHTDRLLLTGTALLNFAAWKKTTSRSNFPWFAFKLSAKPIWWKRYCSRNFCQKICCSYSYGLARAGQACGWRLWLRMLGGKTPPTSCARDRRNGLIEITRDYYSRKIEIQNDTLEVCSLLFGQKTKHGVLKGRGARTFTGFQTLIREKNTSKRSYKSFE